MIDAVWLAARAGAYLLVLQSAGGLIFLAVFARLLPADTAALTRTLCRSGCGALLVCTFQVLLEPAYMAGEVGGLMDPSLWQILRHSPEAWVLGMRLAGMAFLLVALRMRKSGRRAIGFAAVCLALGSFLLSGHTVTSGWHRLLAPLLGLHVLAASFWVGSLWPLRQLAGRMDPVPLAALVRAFSRIAARLVPVLALAGVAMACLLLPGRAALGTAYGLLLCAKVLLFACLMGLAGFNRLRLTPALAQGSTAAARMLQRSLSGEYLLVVVVLGVTAALTGVYSPGGH